MTLQELVDTKWLVDQWSYEIGEADTQRKYHPRSVAECHIDSDV
ncbi:MAG: hypothetical protein ACFFDP_10990 [Promethearchaeota archaeon]